MHQTPVRDLPAPAHPRPRHGHTFRHRSVDESLLLGTQVTPDDFPRRVLRTDGLGTGDHPYTCGHQVPDGLQTVERIEPGHIPLPQSDGVGCPPDPRVAQGYALLAGEVPCIDRYDDVLGSLLPGYPDCAEKVLEIERMYRHQGYDGHIPVFRYPSDIIAQGIVRHDEIVRIRRTDRIFAEPAVGDARARYYPDLCTYLPRVVVGDTTQSVCETYGHIRLGRIFRESEQIYTFVLCKGLPLRDLPQKRYRRIIHGPGNMYRRIIVT